MTGGAGSGCSHWFVRAAFRVLLALACGPLAAAPLTLEPGTAREVSIDAGQTADVHVTLRPGQAAGFTLQQLDATVNVRKMAGPGTPSPLYQNDAGQSARLRLTLVADTHSSWTLRLAATDTARPARIRAALTSVRAATHSDSERALAENALAEAETLRRAVLQIGPGSEAASRIATIARSKFDAALAHARAAADNCLMLVTLADWSRLDYAIADYAASAATARQALRHACGPDDDPAAAAARAVAERTLGSALGYLGDMLEATAAQERALTLYRITGDARYQAMALGNLSADYRVLGRTSQALRTAHEALQLAEAGGNARGAAFARESIAAIHLQRGELSQALENYRVTLDTLEKAPYPMLSGMAWNDLGLLHGQLGDTTAALDAFHEAESAWQSANDRGGLAETWINEADLALDSGNAARAETLYRQALDYDSANRLQRELAHATGGLGRVALARGDFAAARRQFEQQRAIAVAVGSTAETIAAWQGLGELALRQHRDADAIHAFTEAEATARQSGDRSSEAAAIAGRARAEEARGRFDAALAAIEATLAIVEDLHAQITEPALATSYFSVQRTYYEQTIDILLALDRRHPGRHYADRALEVAERARARSLQQLLAQKTIRLDATIDPALLEAERDAEDALRQAAWHRNQLAANASPMEHAAVAREIDAADAAVDRARGRILAAYPRYAALADPPRLDVTAMQRLLGPDAVLLEYWLGAAQSHLWFVDSSGVTAYTLPAGARINGVVQHLRASVLRAAPSDAAQPIAALVARERQARQESARLAADLARTVLAPAAKRIGQRTVVIVADGDLQLVPFALLETGAGGPYRFAYLPSLGALRAMRAAPKPATVPDAIAVFADPVLHADDPRIDAPPHQGQGASANAAATVMPAPDALPPLPFTNREARAIVDAAAPARVHVALGLGANRPAALALDWMPYRYIHFATHAMIDLRHPDLSGIVLSRFDSHRNAGDGLLGMNDIYSLRMDARLVVLGVCDSAIGKPAGPEGLFSLSRAFFYAGADRVLASLWPVDDQASAMFMAAFYRELLREHATPDESLAAAQRSLRTDPRFAAPYYWAGFVLQGDWR